MKRLNIALVAHDARKQELLEWCAYNAEKLSKHILYGTGTTARMLGNIMVPVSRDNGCVGPDCMALPLTVHPVLSGPLGGDSQIGAMIAEGKIKCVKGSAEQRFSEAVAELEANKEETIEE